MIATNYYCLIAGLPDLIVGDKKLPVSLIDFRNLLIEELKSKDVGLVKLLFLPFDHVNLLNAIFHADRNKFDDRGNYSKDLIEKVTDKKELEYGIEFDLPDYLSDVVKEIVLSDEESNEIEAERLLTEGYYKLLQSTSSKFIKEFSAFDQLNRNVFTAMNGRKFDIDFTNELIGGNEINESLKKNRSRDFGLATDVDNIDQLIQIFEQPNILDREMKLDAMKWSFIDDATFFEYFTIDRVLGYVIKLMIVERWFHLDEETGKELFKKLLKELETSYEFPEEFKLSHGKKK